VTKVGNDSNRKRITLSETGVYKSKAEHGVNWALRNEGKLSAGISREIDDDHHFLRLQWTEKPMAVLVSLKESCFYEIEEICRSTR
jgi:hypothetical protein